MHLALTVLKWILLGLGGVIAIYGIVCMIAIVSLFFADWSK